MTIEELKNKCWYRLFLVVIMAFSAWLALFGLLVTIEGEIGGLLIVILGIFFLFMGVAILRYIATGKIK